ncbi:NAD-dependent malic enzyme [Candidatus Kaiserbacteria bacterium CG10_big_fil_rev_8_21_14_0_10_56_12]|uniref:NAD-dependent malic enzyme n=1 Tax=Candidatus Kaiserbacteria bacterium CG10_big_fil_rev_8_21_14_0_10_56_12 TaxID=1974611 RepID=A0A2H0U9R0_9BACT|nr:MAG: NAD-dependent malic enzyme [Candidatus Kaiserbacteria bacterium CG10_big_fil_rev_8_21_14_0_10_56_12]
MDTPKKIIAAFKKQGARIETKARVKLSSRKDFSLWYTPGVGAASTYLAKHPKEARAMSIKKNSVAIVSDGSAVLGLGNIGPYGALPVMEGKALIFKEMGGVDAWPMVLDLTPLKLRKASTQEEIDFIVELVKAIAPGFGGINLEDIAAPACFDIEKRLIEELDIPVMHDDQHGTAIVVLAGLINAAKVVKKNFKKLRVVVSGAGAAGIAVAKLLQAAGIADIILLDRQGTLYAGRVGMNVHKAEIASLTNPRKVKGDLAAAMQGADVFVGVSGRGLLQLDHVKSMAPKSIVFAMANPDPEILPSEAKKGGAAVIATGRSDFPNQINNALVFPGIFRGALDKGVRTITQKTKLSAARALAALVARPTADKIIPDLLDSRVVKAIAKSVR